MFGLFLLIGPDHNSTLLLCFSCFELDLLAPVSSLTILSLNNHHTYIQISTLYTFIYLYDDRVFCFVPFGGQGLVPQSYE